MHVPDGFLDLPTSLATGAAAAAAITIALPRSRSELVADRAVPMLGITAAVIFAAQMVNFPVGPGISGHLMGGALAAVLVGPARAILCLSVVLVVQALLFADGGITALGTNILLLAVVGPLVGWAAFRIALRMSPPRRSSVLIGASLGAFLSVPVAAAAFAVLFAVGGQAQVSLPTLFAAMVGWHTLIGVGEAVITALVVSTVLAARPDLVYGARCVRSAPAPVAPQLVAV